MIGVHEMSMTDYQRDPCVEPSASSHMLHTLLTRSPFHAWCFHPRLGNYPREESDKLDYGSACHDVLLEGAGKLYVIEADDWRTKAAKEAREAARADGRIPLLAHQRSKLDKMVTAAKKAIDAATDFDPSDWHDGQSEQTMIWQEDGTWCRARADRWSADRKILFDYKSTLGSAHPDHWQRQIWGLGYDIQAAHYLTGNTATGGPADARWIWMVQEQKEPFAVSFVSLAPQAEAFAADRRARALALFRDCLTRNYWPAYPQRIAYIDAPAYAVAQFEAQEMEEAA